MHDDRGLLEAFIGDGRPLLLFTGLALIMSGLFAISQAATGHFLPHDVYFLGMDAAELCAVHDCRILHFMIHDRVAFGGTIFAIGALYLWLAEFPLRQRQGWAWWAFLLSGVAGFASFLTYLGYSYLDSWHGVATVALLPFFIAGLMRSYEVLQPPSLGKILRQPRPQSDWRSRAGLGRFCLAIISLGLLSAGLVIMLGGMTRVFVPQDLHYMQLEVHDLQAISPRLVPLIAHDRAGFGGGLFSVGIVMAFCVGWARPSRSLWQILLVAGVAGFGCATGIHFIVGYNNLIHLLPAYVASTVFVLGMVLSYDPMVKRASPVVPATAAPE